MDGGAVRFIVPEDWGAMQDEDPLELNHIEVDISGTGAVPEGDSEVLDDGLSVVATLKTFGKGSIRSHSPTAVAPERVKADGAVKPKKEIGEYRLHELKQWVVLMVRLCRY